MNAQNAAEVAPKVKAGELPGPAKSLAEAVCRVMEQVGYVQKDKQMQGGGSYRYVSVEAVIDALRPEMIKQQLVLLPAGIDTITIETFENKNGTRQNRTQVKYTFALVHAPSGQERPVVVIGEAIDVGDKSSNKAMTAARKYALIMAFNIETGLDPDDTPSGQQERAPAPPAARPAPPPQSKPAPQQPTDEEALSRWAERVAKAGDREALTREWAAYEADVAAGRVPATARPAVVAVFKEAGKRVAQPAKA